MMINATPKNLEWLMERLYDIKRELMAVGTHDAPFVLLTKTRDERFKVERHILAYFTAKYGIDFCVASVEASNNRVSKFCLPIGIQIVLMDVEG